MPSTAQLRPPTAIIAQLNLSPPYLAENPLNQTSTPASTAFSSLSLKPALIKTLDDLGYHEMTAIQAQSLPPILEGKDVLAKAKTGSGKTAAFGLALLSKLKVDLYQVQSLVLCPTRELADQVTKELRRLGRGIHNIKILTLCGGTPFGPQLGSLEHGAHIVVGTPGRINEHLRKRTLNLEHLTTFVLDEADRMLDMGFQDTIDDIIKVVPSNRQTLLFSATYPDSIEGIAKRVLYKPVEITAEANHEHNQILQRCFEIDRGDRNQALVQLLNHYQPKSAVIFCNTKIDCQSLADDLYERGFSALALHGDLEQKARDQVLVRFSNASCCILVATDVAARGLDIKDLECVISYELTRDPEVHVHRIGRTGRAGNKGLALNLCAPSEMRRANAIEDYMNIKLNWANLPTMSSEAKTGYKPDMVCLSIDGGRKDKVRPGDILGALTKDAGIPGADIGKIDIGEFHAYVAISRQSSKAALNYLQSGKIKGRKFKVRRF